MNSQDEKYSFELDNAKITFVLNNFINLDLGLIIFLTGEVNFTRGPSSNTQKLDHFS
jgi:hypothetical protein